MVIAVLLSESVLSICILPKVIFDIDVLSLGLCLSAFILLAVVLSYLKEAYNRKIYFENLEFKYLRFKRNDNIYRYLLQQEKTLKKNEVESIDVGEESAPIVVTIILGLYCHLCAETFKRIRQLLVNSSSDFRFQFHFVSKDVDDEPFVCLYSVYKEKGMSAFVEALNEWYSIHDYAKLGQCCSLEEKEDRLVLYKQQHIEFEEMNRIYKTPTVYVDGKLLPDLYEIGDLVYFV